MQIETLQVYCDLIETASFSAAAERNSVTQSAVSQQIRSLEKKFGVTLIERGKKNFRMTPEGKVFHKASKDMLEIYKGIQTKLEELQNVVAGNLRIATVYSVGLHELPEHVKRFREKYPDVTVDVQYHRSNQVYVEVLEGRVDLGFVAFPKARRGVMIDSCWQDKLVLVCGPEHEFASQKKVRFGDLIGHNFISFEPDMPTRKELDKVFKTNNVTVKQTMEFDNVETVKRAVEIENGISIVPERSVADEIKSGALVVLEIEDQELSRSVGYLQKKSHATSPAMREFIADLKRHAKL